MDVQSLQDALAANGAALKRARQRLARQAGLLEAGGLTRLAVKKVLAVYAISAWQLDLAVEVAQQLSRLPAGHPQMPNREVIRNLFLKMGIDELLGMHTEPDWQRARTFAEQMLAQHAVKKWVATQNFVHGMAPTSAQVFAHFNQTAASQPVSFLPTRRNINRWVAQWRSRWGLKRRKLRDADALDEEALRAKVRIISRNVAPILGPDSSPKNKSSTLHGIGFWVRFPVCFLGPTNPPKFSVLSALCLKFWFQPQPRQVNVFWQTFAYLRQKYASAGKQLLLLNLDETSVLYTPECPVGCVMPNQAWKQRHPGHPHRRVQPKKRRATFTYVAIIADLPAVQVTLPHFLLSSAARMPQQCYRAHHALPKTQLQLLRKKSSWMTAEDLALILHSVGKAVTPWKGEHQSVLFLDVAGAHLPKTVMVAAKKAGIHLLFIPSSTTSLVQPLDVFGFGAFKVWLKQKYQEQRQAETDGQPQLLAWLYHLSQAPQFFLPLGNGSGPLKALASGMWRSCIAGLLHS